MSKNEIEALFDDPQIEALLHEDDGFTDLKAVPTPGKPGRWILIQVDFLNYQWVEISVDEVQKVRNAAIEAYAAMEEGIDGDDIENALAPILNLPWQQLDRR